MPQFFTLGVFAIIFDQQHRVLLCHRRDRDAWNLPGGGISSRELPTEAVVRETKEKTGLNVQVEKLVGIYGKDDRDDLVFIFLCRVIDGELTTTDESDDCRYFEPALLPPNTLARQWNTERIRDAVSPQPQPVFRRQIRSLA